MKFDLIAHAEFNFVPVVAFIVLFVASNGQLASSLTAQPSVT